MGLFERLNIKRGEVLNLAISILVVGFIFSYRMWYSFSTPQGVRKSLNNLLTSIIIVGFSLSTHHLAHKLLARRHEGRSEYKLLPRFLLISLAVTFLTNGVVLLAIPGYIVVSTAYSKKLGYKWGSISIEEEGKIALIGPFINLALAFLFKILSPLLNPGIADLGITINTWLAFLNSLPIPPLDGSKVLMFSRILYIGLIASTFLSLAFLKLLSPLVVIILISLLLIFLFIWGNLKGF